MNPREAAARLAQECYDRALSEKRTTRAVAADLLAQESGGVLTFLATEYLVAEVQRAQRQATLNAERDAERSASGFENPGTATAPRLPRKGTRARAEWERNTPEGREWARAEEEAEMRYIQMMSGALNRALERYAEDLRIQWTADLLDSTFTLADGTPVKWGDATVEQHAERRQMFLNNAHANMEGAARHEVAIRELVESGVASLREMVKVAA